MATISSTIHYGILFPKLFWPTVRKNCPREREKRIEAEGWEFAKILRSLQQFIQTMNGQYNFWNRMLFELVPGGFSKSYTLEQLEFKWEKKMNL